MPGGMFMSGSPAANVVTAPLRVLTRRTRPAGPSVTYSAPSGPIVLPEPQPLVQPGAANEASSLTTGELSDPSALAVEGTAATAAARDNSTVNARLDRMGPPVVEDGA